METERKPGLGEKQRAVDQNVRGWDLGSYWGWHRRRLRWTENGEEGDGDREETRAFSFVEMGRVLRRRVWVNVIKGYFDLNENL